jgi:hypothetical protein
MILIIRGHIRNSFDNKDLYHLVKKINDIVDNLIIYIHTWNIYANNISWREREVNNTQVTKEKINEYFCDLNIVDIIIDDDKKIELIGNKKGNIYNGKMPIIGWKNYWYGKYKIIKHIHEKNIYNEEMVVNMRFDILENSNSLNENKIIEFITTNRKNNYSRNIFIHNYEWNGIDNIYIGNVDTMFKLIYYFYLFLDNILLTNAYTPHQERLVYRVNNNLFDNING